MRICTKWPFCFKGCHDLRSTWSNMTETPKIQRNLHKRCLVEVCEHVVLMWKEHVLVIDSLCDFIVAKMLSSLIDSMHDIIILTIILQKSSHFFQIMTISKNVVLIIETKTVFSVMMYYWNVLIG